MLFFLTEAKLQVLANLANFAYDPVNYSYIRDVGVLDIFLYVLKNETIGRLIRYAIAGVCNLCLGKLLITIDEYFSQIIISSIKL